MLTCIVLAGCNPAGTAARRETELSVVGLEYSPGERVAGFDIKIAGAQVVGLPRVPVGWVVNISNDPNWSAEISGRAIVGAAFVAPEDFLRAGLLIETPSDGTTKIPRPYQTTKVTGFIDLYETDTTRRVDLSTADFRLSPARQP